MNNGVKTVKQQKWSITTYFALKYIFPIQVYTATTAIAVEYRVTARAVPWNFRGPGGKLIWGLLIIMKDMTKKKYILRFATFQQIVFYRPQTISYLNKRYFQ